MHSAILAAVATSNGSHHWNTTQFHCAGIQRLPFYGNEVLCITMIYLALISMYFVTFFDVAMKQMWPETFLDSEVVKRVNKLQHDFPGILAPSTKKKTRDIEDQSNNKTKEGPVVIEFTIGEAQSSEKEAPGAVVEEPSVTYDRVVSQEPYVASSCVDEDLIFILANKEAFYTISSYATCTVRGYAMLSTLFMVSGMFFGGLWVHNASIYPVGTNYARYLDLVSYCYIFLTGCIMMAPNVLTVNRTRNIALWGSIPIKSAILKLHGKGASGFTAVAMAGHVWQLHHYTPEQLPNWYGLAWGLLMQNLSYILFMTPVDLWKKHTINDKQASQLIIFAEIMSFMASYFAFLQNETYASAACAQNVTGYNATFLGTFFGIWAILCVKHFAGAPKGTFTNGPSVLLTQSPGGTHPHHGTGTPVASSGPVPALNFNRETAILPIVQPARK